jgi:hypothetical protein
MKFYDQYLKNKEQIILTDINIFEDSKLEINISLIIVQKKVLFSAIFILM